MERTELLHWIWLSLALGVANNSSASILDAYGTADAVYGVDPSRLSRVEKFSRWTRRALAQKSLSRAAKILDACERKGIGILVYTDERFPDVLRRIKNPPVLLYYRGRLPDLNRRLCIAAVGTRSMSEYGMTSAYKISYDLTRAKALIVSGMALGIDGVCAAAALAAGGETVAILGCGVDVLYPKQHRGLYEEICEHGAIISEYPPSTLPLARHFPERNRLISGMCYATLAFEGDEDSGALITAREALDEGRAVYALPGDVDKKGSRGMNLLLEEGAVPLLSSQDIIQRFQYSHHSVSINALYKTEYVEPVIETEYLERLGVLKKEKRKLREPKASTYEKTAPTPTVETEIEKEPPSEELLSSLSPVQAEILRCIYACKDRASADDIYALPYSYGELSAAMTQMEIKGLIRHLPGSLIGRG